MTKPDSILKSRDITLLTKDHLDKAMVFPVVMYGKGQFSFQFQGRQCQKILKLPQKGLISHVSKVILKILQVRLQQYMNCELPDVQAGFRKGRETRGQIASILWIIKKQESSRKTSISALLTMPKPLTVWITINCGKF